MLSIIIPTLNEETVLEHTLRTIKSGLDKMKADNAGASGFEYEIIISDGRSTDNTLAIAKELAQKTIVYDLPKRQTIAEARNIGARAATVSAAPESDFLVFIDADVRIFDADLFFAKAFRKFGQDPKLVAMTACLKVQPELATLADRIVFGGVNLTFFIINNMLGRIFKLGGASGEFQMMRRSAFDKAGGFSEHIAVGEDNDFFQRLAKIGHTRIAMDLTVYHTGRRAHKIGWPKLLWQWWSNWFMVTFAKRSASSEWTPIR